MPNIKFTYLYRDSANYKKFMSVIFANPSGIELPELEGLIKYKLIDETWFYAEEWKLPEIFTALSDFRIDPTWHEFACIGYTDEAATAALSLNGQMHLIEKTNWIY